MKEYNDPINLRPNTEDRRILDKLKAYLAKLTKQEVFDTAAMRFALRYWEEHEEIDVRQHKLLHKCNDWMCEMVNRYDAPSYEIFDELAAELEKQDE